MRLLATGEDWPLDTKFGIGKVDVALSNLQYGLFSAKAVTVLIGEAGTGKTTLLRAALESDRCRDVRCVYLNNPALTRPEFVEMLCAPLRAQPRGRAVENHAADRARAGAPRATGA